MTERDPLQRYMELARALSQMTRTYAEEIVKDLRSAGEGRRSHTQHWVEDIIERGRTNTEVVMEVVRDETARQLEAMGISAGDDLDRLTGKLSEVATAVLDAARQAAAGVGLIGDDGESEPSAGTSVPVEASETRAADVPSLEVSSLTPAHPEATKAPAKKAATNKAATKKAGAEKAGPNKAGATKSAAKKAATKKAGAEKSAAKKAATKKADAEKSAAKKAGAEKAGPKKAGVKKAAAKKAAGSSARRSG